jgi:hypothetical protein
MAYDDGRDGRDRDLERRQEQGRQRDRGGHPERLGDRHARDMSDDPDYGSERYGGGASQGFGSDGGGGGPMTSDPDSLFGAPGFDAEFGGPRFDRQDVGSTGTHGVHPVSSPFGGAYGGGYGASAGGFQSSARRYAALRQQEGGSQQHGGSSQSRQYDPHYAQWRTRQMEQLDRDYEEYCLENQSKFEREFGAWREKRGQQRQSIGRVTEHMEVVGSDGSHVGTVDRVSGDSIILTRSDPKAGGIHHSIPCSWIEKVDDKVTLNLAAEEATYRWREEGQSQALFEREGRSGRGFGEAERSSSGSSRE